MRTHIDWNQVRNHFDLLLTVAIELKLPEKKATRPFSLKT